MLSGRFGLIDWSLACQLPQHIVENAAMTVIIDLVQRIDSAEQFDVLLGAV
jgi:hypothetical protein